MKRILIVHNEPFIPSLRGNTKAIWEYCNVLKKLGCELYYCVTSNCNLSQEFIDYFEGRVVREKGDSQNGRNFDYWINVESNSKALIG